MKRILFISIIALLIILYFSFTKKEKKLKPEPEKIVSFSFVGDLMCHSPQYEYAKVGDDEYDFVPVFREIKNLLSSADFTIGNLETVIAGKEKRYGSYPMFNSPEEYLSALKESGFDILITSNNHSIDRGTFGIERTIEKIKEYGMSGVGTNKSLPERDSIRIFEKNGIKFILLAYTYGLNGNLLPKNKSFMVNLIDTILIKNDIYRAKNYKSDLILVYFHFGEEYERRPNSFQKEIVSKVVSYGADVIIASHPHVIQPIKFFKPLNKKLDTSFVAYSLGNFLSNQRWRYSDCGVILNFSFKKIDSSKIVLNSISTIPTWVYKGSVAGKREFVILPGDTSSQKSFLKYLSKSDKEKMHQSYKDTKGILAINPDWKQ